MNLTKRQLRSQFDRVIRLGWLPFFEGAARTITAGYFDTADLIAIGSRETNLDPKWLTKAGDHGNGFGLMQADKRSFPEFTKGDGWKDARTGIIFGAKVLMQKWADFEKNVGKTVTYPTPKFTAKPASGSIAQHIAIAGYNCGRWSQYAWAKGQDIDAHTTGKDYGCDVMERAAVIRGFLSERADPQAEVGRPTPAAAAAVEAPAQSANAGEPQPAPTQNAEQITNITGDKTVPDNFVPEDKTVDAPPKEGTTAKAATMTVAGFAVPTFLVGIVTAFKSAMESGFVSAQQIGEVMVNFIAANTKYVFAGLGLVITGMLVKKVCKQVTLWLSMYFAARADMHNVTVKPQ